MTTTPLSPIAADFERLNTLNEYVSLQTGRPDGENWYSPEEFTQPDSPALDEILGRIRGKTGCDDRHFLAASFAGGYVWQMAVVGVGCFLAAHRLPDLSADNLRMRFDDNGWNDRLSFIRERFYALSDDSEATDSNALVVDNNDMLRDLLRQQMENHMSRVIDALKAKTTMGKRGMWGIVADRMAGIVIHATEQLGQSETCEHEVEALIQVADSPLKGKTGVMRAEHNGHQEMYLKRGSCCQYYKVPGYGYCITCPLQSKEERERRMREYVAREEE
jgi:ferric iron reductase protein FhuF